MSEFAIFIEGGGNSRREQGPLRIAFQSLFSTVLVAARERKIRHRVILCGGRSETIKLFLNEVRLKPTVRCFLLVDSEEPLGQGIGAREHLAARDEDKLQKITAETIGVMITVMETWICSDKELLEEYFGKGFDASALPDLPNLETVAKTEICERLDRATRKSRKGVYHKQKHGPDLLAKLNRDVLRRRCPAFGSFIDNLADTLK